MVKRLSAMRATRGSIPGGDASPGGDDPLEKEMAIHSSIFVWRIPWTQEPGRLQSMGSQSRRHLSDFTFFSLLFFSKHPSTAKPLERHALPFRHKKWGLIQAQAHLWRHEWGLTQAHAHLWSPERAPLGHAHLRARPERERLLGTRRHSASPPSGLRSRPKRPSLSGSLQATG